MGKKMIQSEIEYHEKILSSFIEEAKTCPQYVHNVSTMCNIHYCWLMTWESD